MSFRRFGDRLPWSILLVPLVLTLVMIAVFAPYTEPLLPAKTLTEYVRDGKIDYIVADATSLHLTTTDARKYHLPRDGASITATLMSRGLTAEQVATLRVVEAAAPPQSPGMLPALTVVLVLAGTFAFWAVLTRDGRETGQAKEARRHRAAAAGATGPVDAAKLTTTFADVAGVEEAAGELLEVVEFLRCPERFAALGARVPRGILLVGPPGTGKTLLARAVAGEAGVPFYSISGSEFVEVYVGVGAARVRDLFRRARESAPCIIFIDEIDTIGRKRSEGAFAVNEEREQALNQILVEMDGFDKEATVVVLAATNRPDVLDPALLRPGRFDRRVSVDPPDRAGREAILRIHLRDKPLADDADLSAIAASTPGFTGADLANLANEAAIVAARRHRATIGAAELEEAMDRVVAGPERKGHPLSPREKRIVAYHEAGHALVAQLLGDGDSVRKVTILPRGAAGGFTSVVAAEDRSLWTRAELEGVLASALAGRAAEELVLGERTSGAENDFQRATAIARRMVSSMGMGERLGPVAVAQLETEGSGGGAAGEYIGRRVYEEVAVLLGNAMARARGILDDNREALEALATALLERETLGHDEIAQIVSAHRRRVLAAPSRKRPMRHSVAASNGVGYACARRGCPRG